MFLAQLAEGHIDRRTSEQLFDPERERFLPDRFVEGTCPHCDYPDARGDQCDNCGRTLDPTDLIDPRSKLSGATPVLRETEHYYYRYSDFADRLKPYLESRKGWRAHVLNFALGWLDEGLLDRAITRDIEWGVELPVDDLGPGKRIYVWYDAVIGYLSASQEWAESTGDPDRWQHWWHNDDARHVYFIGKDNIPFHALFWPSQLMGVADRMEGGELHLPDDIPANQYVTFSGGKASASRGIGLTIDEGLERFQPDALRYALAAAFPEQADTEISEEQIGARINDELVATWGNLVNRVLTMVNKNCDGAIPSPGERAQEDVDLLAGIDEYLAKSGRGVRGGQAAGRPADRHGRGPVGQPVPDRHRAVEAGQERVRSSGTGPGPCSTPPCQCHQRGPGDAGPLPAVLVGHPRRDPRPALGLGGATSWRSAGRSTSRPRCSPRVDV